MSEQSGLLNLADRLERLIHGNLAAVHRMPIRPRAGTPGNQRPSVPSVAQAPGTVATAVLPELETEVPEAEPPPVPASVPNGPEAAPRILVAEADPLHGEILARLVENTGYAVDLVNSAADAVAAFMDQAYVLVMLDCDSREMTGLETAARIRLLEGYRKRTPMVAITADSGQEQRKQRKAAGVDNYLSRPILRENVKTVLSRYAPLGAAEPLARYLALDRHRLVELEEAAGGRADVLDRWIQLFLTGAPVQLDRMRAAHEDGDAAELCRAARKLRSFSGQIGALRVQEICGIIDALSGSGSLAGIESLLPDAALALERAVRELHALENEMRDGRRLASAAPGAAGHKIARSSQILVVEDDPLIARFLASSLTGAGFPVTHLMGGRAAVNALRETEFGAVILDLDVREVDGFGVLSAIRVSPDRAIPVMIVSSRHQEQDILRAFELGADDYVTIPFNPLEVVVRLRRLVRLGAPPA